MTPLMPTKITDYASLKQAILSVVDRGDDEFKAALDVFIMDAESTIYTELRTPANEVRVTHVAANDGTAVNIPNGLLEIRDVYRNGLPVGRLTQDEYALATSKKTGRTGYSRSGGTLVFVPELDVNSTDEVTVVFWIDWSVKKQSDSDSNPLLVGNPDLYLSGCLVEAFLWTNDEDRSAFYERKFGKKIDAIKALARNDDQSGGTLQIRGAYQ
ncbi:hypothetical protein HOP38_02685 [Vibrio mediterranei]|uniref:phage adaptor protein n=1 Tax=Vibrio mediterranei TaxID=689 RepID=UPI00179AC51F|nr:hypothetical protein [Vibrio mediterranei]NUW71417.1 hypothetical protein [Vibrio mediterranei]